MGAEVINGKRVVCWTPYGRRPTYSLLVQYLAREVERGIVDEVWAYENLEPHSDGWSDPAGDRVYLEHLASTLPSWFQVKQRPADCPYRQPVQRNTGYAYRYMTDPDTVYIRMDDDLVYLHEDAVTNLVGKRLANSYPVAIFGTTWNNAIVSWFAQQQGVIPRQFDGDTATYECGFYCMDPVGWANGAFAVHLHEMLLEHATAGTADKLYLYQDFPIQAGTQFSVSFFASLGSMYRDLPAGPGVLHPDQHNDEEESWHTQFQPRVIGTDNLLIGDSLVSHFTFKPQKPHVMGSNLLERYTELAVQLTG